jgi:tetratricopeptide (TPR) repeat protein
VRRRITAQIVWCEQACGQPVAAGEEFLILVRSDPETPYFACIPLAWLPAQPSPELEQAARGWLGRNELPAATLLGASHLMSTARPQALDCLKQLATSSDSRIAQLAIAQSWRAAVVTAGEDEVAGWERAIERMPEGLRAGPYYVLGSALLRQQRWERAALALMRVPILYPVDQSLAARCLLDAGSALERLGRPQQAVGLYRELTAMHAPPRDQTEARSRLEALGGANERR